MGTFLKKLPSRIKLYAYDNILFLTYAFSAIVNSFLLRMFTVKLSYNQVKPMIADIAMVLFIGMFAYLIKPKRRIIYYTVWTTIFALISVINCIYYTNYKSFVSVSLLSTASQLGGVLDAVTENILEAKDLIFIWSILAIIGVNIFIRKKKPDYFEKLKERKLGKRYFLSTMAISVSIAGIFATTLTGTDLSRLAKQWNREYVLGTFGLYTYQVSDTISCLNSKINLMFNFDKSKVAFEEFYEEPEVVKEKEVVKNNEYSDIFKGKNVLVIHAESIQQFVLDTSINGEALTPNLNKLVREGLYFSNVYAQESVGTSSDSEFTFASSLMPASSGTVAINYWDRDYTTTQSMLRDMGYYTFSMHGNNGSYWNRLNLHKALGYDKFYNYTTDFNIDETIGLGLSDKSFFNQAVPMIKDISKEHTNFYGTLIMLTNHTPFTDIERVSDFEVDFKYKKYNEETGLYEEVSAPFLEGKKLGSYFKSVHYADEAIGQLMTDLDSEGLLDNTVVVIYGDHDAKIKEEEYNYYFNYNPFTEEVLTESDPGYVAVDDFSYNLNRKIPFILWSKDGGYEPEEIDTVMGMYDIQPTLGNLFGFENKYALGHDIFSIKEDEENIVIFPNGNFVTDTIYYDSQKDKYFDLTAYVNPVKVVPCNEYFAGTPNPVYLETIHGIYKGAIDETYNQEAIDAHVNDGIIDETYITDRSKYAEERISISNAIIYYDMINKTGEGFGDGIDTTDMDKDEYSIFSPPSSSNERDRLLAA